MNTSYLCIYKSTFSQVNFKLQYNFTAKYAKLDKFFFLYTYVVFVVIIIYHW